MPGAFSLPFQDLVPPFGGRPASPPPAPWSGPSVTPFNRSASNPVSGPSLMGGGSAAPRADGYGVMMGGLEKAIPKLRALLDRIYGGNPIMNLDPSSLDAILAQYADGTMDYTVPGFDGVGSGIELPLVE